VVSCSEHSLSSLHSTACQCTFASFRSIIASQALLSVAQWRERAQLLSRLLSSMMAASEPAGAG
jgi:hypothetical protein